MSELHRAVQAEVDAHTPTSIPPFSMMRARKRRRSRRNLVAAGTALAVSGAVVGLGVVPALSNDDEAGSVVAGADDTVAVPFHLVRRAGDVPGGELEVRRCLALPGTSDSITLFSFPAQYSVTVTGTKQIRAFEACAAAAGYSATRKAIDDQPAADPAYARPHECPDGDTSLYDAVPFLMVGDQMYLQRGGASRTTRLGPRLFEVVCDMRDGAPDDGYENQGGDAAFLSAGTPVHEVLGFDPAFRVAATYDGQVVLFEAERRETARTGAEVFPGVAEHVVAITVLSAQDALTVIAREDDPAKVREMTAQLMASPNGSKASIAERDVFVGLVLDDGTTVARAYLSREGVLHPGLTLPTEFREHVQALLRSASAPPSR